VVSVVGVVSVKERRTRGESSGSISRGRRVSGVGGGGGRGVCRISVQGKEGSVGGVTVRRGVVFSAEGVMMPGWCEGESSYGLTFTVFVG